MNYFAYGSNMSLQRLRQRVPSARLLGTCRLPGYSLRFHKVGQDGSAKCDAFVTDRDRDSILGGLFDICDGEKGHLDRIEGVGCGYEVRTVCVRTIEGRAHRAFTYIATRIDPLLKPFLWYRHHVLVGARELCLPPDYIAGIETVEAIADPDGERDRAQRAIYLG